MVALGVVAVVSLSFVLPGVLGSKSALGGRSANAVGIEPGFGLRAGSAVPAFSGRDVLTGTAITSGSLYGQRTLLFFSEGVACQACLQQIQSLQQVGAELKQRGIRLVSITPDPSAVLRQAIAQYGITTPVISDSDLRMSEAFNTIGQGMHADTPGHAFALIYHGRVLWYRDYWLAPDHAMYVDPARLLADITPA